MCNRHREWRKGSTQTHLLSDISMLVATTFLSSSTKLCLSRQNIFVCHDKHTFVATKHVFCRDKHMFVFCRNKNDTCAAPANDRRGLSRNGVGGLEYV